MNSCEKTGHDSQNDGSAIAHLIQTFVNILLSCGFSAGEILRLVQAAAESGRQSGNRRRATGSVAEHLACTDVVYSWRHDPEFLDGNGEPKALMRTGGHASLETLVSQSAPDHDPASILQHLSQLGAVRSLEDGTYELLTESVLACNGTDDGIVVPDVVLLHLQGMLGTVEYNLRTRTCSDDGRFDRACYSRIPLELTAVFRNLVEQRGQEFVDGIDEWLVRHRTTGHEKCHDAFVGAGAYMFCTSFVGPV